MPYFSFSLKQNLFEKNQKIYDFSKIQVNRVFFSKNTYLWKKLNKKKNKKYINFVKFIIVAPILITFTIIGSLVDFLFGPRANLTIVVKHN